MTIRNALFDLDGALTDAKEGIIRCMQHALEKMDRPAPPTEDLMWCIGPPLMSSFQKILDDPNGERALQAVAHYRERFGAVGKFENRLYPGIPETLERIGGMGIRCFVATSKPLVFAAEIIEHFGLAPYFETVYGSELSGVRSDKGELIGYVLEKEGLRPEETVMIGDRREDAVGAHKCGVVCIGAGYGYAADGELAEAGVAFIADRPIAIPDLIAKIRL